MISRYLKRQNLEITFRSIRTRVTKPPTEGWIQRIRVALGMSQAELAIRMGVNQKSVHAMEISEQSKKIKLETLEKAADALGCKLYYILVPDISLEEMHYRQAYKLAEQMEEELVNTMALENAIIKKDYKRIEHTARVLQLKDAVKWK